MAGNGERVEVKFNPFKPGSIVHPGMFVGRLEELKTLEKALFQTINGNPAHFLIHGERGIGKSSLLLLLTSIAKGATESIVLQQKFDFLTVSVELEPNDDYADLISKIARQLQRELDKSEVLKTKLKGLWDFITKWEVMGVKYKRETTPVEAMLEEIADKFSAIGDALEKTNSGVYIFIDEADKPINGAGLGEFVKVFSERLTKNGTTNVALGVIGISNVIDKMRESHASSVRIFTPVPLNPLSHTDSKKVVLRGITEADSKNQVKTAISPEALKMIADLSEGYPYFIQQYAFSAFDHDTNNAINDSDVKEALIKEGGALQLLGQRYFENIYTDDIRSDDYRKVLQVIARHMPEETTRKQIISESGLKDQTVDNALGALKKRGSVVPVSGKVGLFKLPSMSFAAWIEAFKIGTVDTAEQKKK